MKTAIKPINIQQEIVGAKIVLQDLRLKVHLGHTEDERGQLQEVRVDFTLYFPDLPKACATDELDDTVCYYELSKVIEYYCQGKEFKLLEYLCYQLFQEIKSYLPAEVKLWLRVEKCYPPLQNVLGAISFEYGE